MTGALVASMSIALGATACAAPPNRTTVPTASASKTTQSYSVGPWTVCGQNQQMSGGELVLSLPDAQRGLPAPWWGSVKVIDLQLTTDCSHGGDLQLSPLGAADIEWEALAEDGRLAAVRLSLNWERPFTITIAPPAATPFVLRESRSAEQYTFDPVPPTTG